MHREDKKKFEDQAVAPAWMRGGAVAGDLKPVVGINELTSLNAMIAYIAFQSGQSEFNVERNLADRFNVANVKAMPAHLYDHAMRYLVDGLRARG